MPMQNFMVQGAILPINNTFTSAPPPPLMHLVSRVLSHVTHDAHNTAQGSFMPPPIFTQPPSQVTGAQDPSQALRDELKTLEEDAHIFY